MGSGKRKIFHPAVKADHNLMKINFKRKKGGGGGNWGQGLDYLLEDFWEKLDELVEDNYYGRHNKRLINFLFPKVSLALKNSVSEMKRSCEKGEGLSDWIKKAERIRNFSKSAKNLSCKVIFIDSATQFLRETYVNYRPHFHKKIIKTNYNLKELKGIIASPLSKNIKGKIRVVLSEKDFLSFKKGEILVAKETSASFLPLIRKAKAIITDEGGLLCHAAITAREMKKPCVVGTKAGSRVLKTGDWVEISADGKISVEAGPQYLRHHLV